MILLIRLLLFFVFLLLSLFITFFAFSCIWMRWLIFHEVTKQRPLLLCLFKHYKPESFEVIKVFGRSFHLLLKAVQILKNKSLSFIVIVTGLYSSVVLLINLLDKLFIFGGKITEKLVSRLLLCEHIVELIHDNFGFQLPQYLCHLLLDHLIRVLDHPHLSCRLNLLNSFIYPE